MSSGSDWVNLFVHQGKEFFESVSGQRKRSILASESQGEVPNSSTKVAFENDSNGSLHFEGNDDGASLKATESTSMALGTKEDSSSVEETKLTQGEKEVYENQLEQLQEQMVDIMIKNQEMDAELTALRESDVSKLAKELDREKIKRKQLEAKLKKVKEDQDSTPKLRRRKRHTDGLLDQNDQSTSADHQSTGYPNVSDIPPEIPEGNQSRVSRFKFWVYRWYTLLAQKITLTFWNIVSDLSDDEVVRESVDEDGPPLAIKTLKDNINRFSSGIKPIKEFFKKIDWVLSWKNPAATMLIFLVYVFSFWRGFTVTLSLFLLIVQLSANFIYSRFGTLSDKPKTEPVTEPPSWSDRFQVVLHVARKVQNVLGSLSDDLEKIKNLLTWKVPHVTLKLYVVLWLLFVSSVFLNGPQFFTLVGMLLGFKLFVVGPVYNRFPKLKKRYDTTHQLWLELPTDCDVGTEMKQSDADETHGSNSHRPSLTSESSGIIPDYYGHSRLFCERYKLATEEVFIRGWEDGWRTSLMDKQRPLVNIKHGRLYLTQNYLCFERSRTNIARNILMKLTDIKSVNKYKPYFFLPGTGMSIEVCMKDKDEPYIFAAMIGRDNAYNDIIQTARNAGLSWAR